MDHITKNVGHGFQLKYDSLTKSLTITHANTMSAMAFMRIATKHDSLDLINNLSEIRTRWTQETEKFKGAMDFWEKNPQPQDATFVYVKTMKRCVVLIDEYLREKEYKSVSYPELVDFNRRPTAPEAEKEEDVKEQNGPRSHGEFTTGSEAKKKNKEKETDVWSFEDPDNSGLLSNTIVGFFLNTKDATAVMVVRGVLKKRIPNNVITSALFSKSVREMDVTAPIWLLCVESTMLIQAIDALSKRLESEMACGCGRARIIAVLEIEFAWAKALVEVDATPELVSAKVYHAYVRFLLLLLKGKMTTEVLEVLDRKQFLVPLHGFPIENKKSVSRRFLETRIYNECRVRAIEGEPTIKHDRRAIIESCKSLGRKTSSRSFRERKNTEPPLYTDAD